MLEFMPLIFVYQLQTIFYDERSSLLFSSCKFVDFVEPIAELEMLKHVIVVVVVV